MAVSLTLPRVDAEPIRRRPRRAIVAVVAMWMWIVTGSAIACPSILAAALSGADLDAAPTGLDAALVLAEAIQRTEPALPALVPARLDVSAFSVREAKAVVYLDERNLLAGEWESGTLSSGVWHHVLRTWTSWYGLDPPDVALPTTRSALIQAVGEVETKVAEQLRPALLYAPHRGEANSIAFRALIWNWSIYPRLIVYPSLSRDDGPIHVQRAIETMESCVVRIRHWIALSESAARRLYMTHRPSRMVVVGTEPNVPELTPWWVPVGQELDVLAYDHPAIRHLDVFSVVFVGEPLPFTGWLQLLPHVRTNASPIDLRRYLQTPPSTPGR